MKIAPPMPNVVCLLLTLLITVLAAACSVDGGTGPGATSSTAALPEQGPYQDQPDEDVPPATAPPARSVSADRPDDRPDPLPGDAHFDGYGHAVFGMDADQVRSVWVGELGGEPAAGGTCFQLHPLAPFAHPDFALMFEDGRFVRYSVSNDELIAPGGGRRGMDIAQIQRLYPGRVEQRPHKYVEGGQYLRITDNGGSDGVLVFETDASGNVTGWRVGVPPQIDYVEGCG